MTNLDALYSDLLLSHSKSPKNYGPLSGFALHAREENPFCGDRLTVHVQVAGERVVACSFEGDGCAVSMASASMMTIRIANQTVTEVHDLFARFERLLSGESGAAAGLGELAAFAGVARFAVRVRCARLPWSALMAALGSIHVGGGEPHGG